MTQRRHRRVRSAGRQSSTAENAVLSVAAAPVASAEGLERAKGGAPQFTEEQLRRIDGIVAKANPQATAFEQLHVQVSDLLVAVGITDDGTENSQIFRKLASEAEDQFDKARRFRKIATSGNPLKPALYANNMMAELYLALHQPRKPSDPIIVPSYRAHLTTSLAKYSAADIQSAARRLAVYHQSQVRRGPRSKHDLDTLLDQLADIYAIITGYNKHRHCLSLSDRSLFGKFSRAALEPHCEASESSFAALGRRWERIKRDASRPAEYVRKAPKRLLRPRKKQDATAT